MIRIVLSVLVLFAAYPVCARTASDDKAEPLFQLELIGCHSVSAIYAVDHLLQMKHEKAAKKLLRRLAADKKCMLIQTSFVDRYMFAQHAKYKAGEEPFFEFPMIDGSRVFLLYPLLDKEWLIRLP